MAYTYTRAELSPLDASGAAIYTYNLLAEKGKFAFGELLNLRLQITSSSNLTNGSLFVINPCLFGFNQFQTQIVSRQGWVVEIVNIATGTFNIYFNVNNAAASVLERNYTASAVKVSAKVFNFDLVFYACQDTFSYLQGVPQNNAERLLSSALGTGLLEANQPNVYSRTTSYLEVLSYAADANLNPLTSGGDPYVRSPLNPSEKQGSFEVAGRFIDNEIGAVQAYSGTNLLYNNLSAFVVSASGFGKINEAARLPFPTLDNFNDVNFAYTLQPDGSPLDMLMLDQQNELQIVVKIPYSTPTKIVVHLLRVDDSAFANAQFFPLEYDIQRANLVASAVPYPNPINSTPFSTPTTIVSAAGLTTITTQIDGGRLVAGATYRVWVGLYEVAGRYISSHLTPPVRAILQRPPSLTISGVNQSYNNSFTGNDTVMTTLARHKSGVVLDSSTYTGVSFLNELRGVKFIATYDGTVLENGRYDFLAQNGAGTPQIDLQVLGASYFFSYQSRLPYNGTLANKTLQIDWSIDFEYRDRFGSLQRVSYSFTQFIRVRPINTTRIVSMQFLDYTDWLAAIITPVRSLCEDNPFVVIQVEKNGAPDANLIALAIIGNAQNSTTPPTIYEEESYISPTLMAQSSAVMLSQVEPSFVDDYAYFVLDTRYLPQGNLGNAVGAIVYDI